MRGKEFLEKLEYVDPKLVEEAGREEPRRRGRRGLWISATAAVLALAFLAGVLLWPGEHAVEPERFAVALAAYPEMVQYPDEADFLDEAGELDSEGYSAALRLWWEEHRERSRMAEGQEAGLDAFCAATIPAFLGGAEGENRVYSPLNVYFALGMLAEATGGESREQILKLLGLDSMETLRAQVNALWNANYCDDGAVTSILAASLWLNEGVPFVQETVDTLAETYYASAYRGEMGSEEMNEALRAWLNAQTGGLLAEQAEGLELSADTVLALATTIYFRAKWSNEFREEDTAPGTFYSPAGETTCEFMHQSGADTYYWGEQFSAIRRGLDNSGSMWFLLPDEGVSPEALLEDEEVMAFLAGGEWEQEKYLTVNQALPRFDIAGEIDLIDGLKALGVTDVFDAEISDFTPMTGAVEGIFLSRAQHAARVAMDEEGVTAAAYTVMQGDAGDSAPPEEEVDFVADRPFLFAITGAAGQLLFVGIVNQPA